MRHHRSRAAMVVAAALAIAVGILVPTGSAGAAVLTPRVMPQIGFMSGDYSVVDGAEVYLANADGTGLVNLSQGGVRAWSWSPDGSKIAFVSGRSGTVDLWVAEVGAEPGWWSKGVEVASPAWSPDGTRIAYLATGDVWVVDAAATSRNVSNDAAASSDPLWAPTAQWLAYRSGDSLFLADASAGTPLLLTDHYVDGASWSSEGDRFLFVADTSGDDDVYVVDVTAANPGPVKLTNSPANDRDPAWSLDGTGIAFSSGLETFDGFGYTTVIASRIHMMNADGSNRRTITDGSMDYDPLTPQYSVAQRSPTWSPDGAHLAVVATSSGPSPHARAFTVSLVNPAGPATAPITLTVGGGGYTLRWSPYADQLAVHAQGSFNLPTVTVVTSDGIETTVIGDAINPAWSPHWSFLAYEDFSAVGPTGVFVQHAPPAGFLVEVGESLGDPNGWDAAWRPVAVDPVGMVDPATGRWYLRDGTGWIRSFYYGNPGDVPFTGDWDCDGVDTPGLYRQADGYVYLRNSNTPGVADLSFFFGNPGDVPIAGDFDGDGCDTVSIYRPSEQMFYVIDRLASGDTGLGAATSSFLFGNPGDVPVVGDWDGNGVDDIGLHRPDTGFFYWRNTLSTGTADGNMFFGDPGDRFIAGDWSNADGKDTPAVFRPTNTTFYLKETLTQGVADNKIVFGRSGWLPVAGHFGP